MSPYRSLFVIPPSVRRSLGRFHNRRAFFGCFAEPEGGAWRWRHTVQSSQLNKAKAFDHNPSPPPPPPARRGRGPRGLADWEIFLFCGRRVSAGVHRRVSDPRARKDLPEASLDVSSGREGLLGDHGGGMGDFSHLISCLPRRVAWRGGVCAGPRIHEV